MRNVACRYLVFGATVASVTGCAQRDWQECSSGLLCASPNVCAEPSGLCVPEDAIRVCEGKPAGAPCSIRLTQSQLNAVSALAADRAFAAGDAGTFLRYDGASWEIQEVDSVAQINGMWARSDVDVFAVGDERAAFRFDGTSWLPVGNDAPSNLEAVFGTAGDVWAVGDNYVGRFDGTQFVDLAVNLGVDFTGVWASGPNDIWVSADAGRVAHFDGAAWNLFDTGANEDLEEIWGAGPADLFAVGVAGTIVHYDGAGWGSMTSSTTVDLEGVGGRDGLSVFAVGVGGTLVHYDGLTWTALSAGTTLSLGAISVIGDIGFAVGSGGTIVQGTGTSWIPAVVDGACQYGVCILVEGGP